MQIALIYTGPGETVVWSGLATASQIRAVWVRRTCLSIDCHALRHASRTHTPFEAARSKKSGNMSRSEANGETRSLLPVIVPSFRNMQSFSQSSRRETSNGATRSRKRASAAAFNVYLERNYEHAWEIAIGRRC